MVSITSSDPPSTTKIAGSHKQIWLAIAVSYVERLAAFAMPLLMLRGGGGQETFISVEYVISISIIAATFFDLGLRGYVMYHFRLHGDARVTTMLTARAFLLVFLAQIAILVTTTLAVSTTLDGQLPEAAFTLGVARGVALSIIGLTTQLLILNGRPLTGMLISLSAWLFGAAAFVLPDASSIFLRLNIFFSATFLIILATPVALWFTTGFRVNSDGIRHFAQSFRWGWPLLAGAAASILVAHLSRIYAFSNFDLEIGVGFAFWLRIFSVMQLNHKATIAVLSPRIFSHTQTAITSDVVRAYQLHMAPSVIFSFVTVALAPTAATYLSVDIPTIPFTVAAALGFYTLLWCSGAFLELYLVRESHTREVLVAGLVPAAGFMVFLFSIPSPTITAVSIAMLVSSAVQCALLARLIKLRRQA